MIAKVIPFPKRERADAGTLHVYRRSDGIYEVGLESPSGDVWGRFDQHRCPWAAVEAAHRINREEFGGRCDVRLARHVCHALSVRRRELGGA